MRRSITLALAGLLAAALLAACGGTSATATNATAQTTRNAAKARPGRAAARRPLPPTPVLIPPAGAPARSVTVPVLTYHRVHTLPAVGQLDLIVDPTTFARDLQALQSAGYHPIHQWQLFDALYKGMPLPPRPVIISVDDGYVDDVRTILPDLERFHMVATFFVITGRTTEPGFLSADQIRELDRAGMDVGDHTAHHVDLRLLTGSELQSETAGSKRALEQILGHPVYYFAYPFGAYNATVEQALHAAGFTMAYTTAAGTAESTSDPLTMPRIHVGRDETPQGLLSILGGQ